MSSGKRRLPVASSEEHCLRVERHTAYRMLLEDQPIPHIAMNAHAYAEKTFRELPHRDTIECKKGCSFCCHVGVSCTAPEAMAIADHVAHLDPTAQTELRARLNHQEEQIRGRTKEEQFSSHVACGFLDGDGACSIYQVRPLQCRSWNSADRSSCEEAFNRRDPAAYTTIHGPSRQSLNAIMVGMSAGLEDAGLDGRSLRLMPAVRAFLEDPSLEERWAASRRLPDHLLERSAPLLKDYGSIEENDAWLERTFGHK